MKQLLLSITIIFYSTLLNAQIEEEYKYSRSEKWIIKKQKTAYQKINLKDYKGAIEILEEIINKYNINEAKLDVARYYFDIRDFDNASYWYSTVLPRIEFVRPYENTYDALSICFLKYNHLQRDCKEIQEWFNIWKSKYYCIGKPIQKDYLDYNICEYLDSLSLKNIDNYNISNVVFNTGKDEINPIFFKNKIVFISGNKTPRKNNSKEYWKYDYKLLMANKSNKISSFLKNEKINNIASISIAENGNAAYSYHYTYNEEGWKGLWQKSIYSSLNNTNNEFLNKEEFAFSSDEYSIGNPFLTADGQTIYFASDMPGGFGGMDLYMSVKENGRWNWSPPINLGPDINSEGNDNYPFLSEDNILYFSSEYRHELGLGGLDIYYSKKMDGKFNEWGEIHNLGAPFNSNKDDIDFVIDKENNQGYFSSNRDGGKGGFDIYHFIKK